jgi:uncharacterized protein (DUF2267 family)
MQLNDFLGEVQHQARMSSLDEAMCAARATLPEDVQRLFDAGSEGAMGGG